MPGSERPPADWKGWPQEKKFALVLTHDVESEIGLNRVKQLAELEMGMGFRSAFYFIPEGEYAVPKELREWLIERGFEVAIHDHRHDGKLFHSRAGFNRSADSINRFLREWQAVGFRSAFMLRNLRWLPDLEVLYDASTFDTDPFEPQPDGVNTIFPLWVRGANGRRCIELPYTLPQDFTLFVILQEQSIKIWQDKLQWIVSHGGMALLDVHPDYLSSGSSVLRRNEYPASRYEEFLTWIKQTQDGQYWHALPKDVALFSRTALPPHSQPVARPENQPHGPEKVNAGPGLLEPDRQ